MRKVGEVRDPKRIDVILESLRKRWERCPDLRLGQIIVNAAEERGHDLFCMEDDELLQELERGE